MQEEDFTTDRVVHLVGEVANLIEHLVSFEECLCGGSFVCPLHYRSTFKVSNFNDC